MFQNLSVILAAAILSFPSESIDLSQKMLDCMLQGRPQVVEKSSRFYNTKANTAKDEIGNTLVSDDEINEFYNLVASGRVEHSRELLGKYYTGSVVKTCQSECQVEENLRSYVRKKLKKRYKGLAKSISRTILEESKKYALDPLLITAMILQESNFNPSARGTSGEYGLMQIMPKTGEYVAKKYGITWSGNLGLTNPIRNIKIGAAYIDFLRKEFDSQGQLYISAYNMGSGNVKKNLKVKRWPKFYVQGVMKHYIGLYRKFASTNG